MRLGHTFCECAPHTGRSLPALTQAGTLVEIASRVKRLLLRTALYAGITAATLGLVDLVCMLFGFFPPIHDYGDPDVGWVGFSPTGEMHTDWCVQYATGDTISFIRNEDGIRTHVGVDALLTDQQALKIAVTGDSQTELCAPNAETHAGFLESSLNANGTRTVVLPYGAGRYSPLQDYLVFKARLKKFEPDALVLNLYTGNDFYDLLRVDDRPYFDASDAGYQIAEPTWYLYDDPRIVRRSRVLFALRSLAKQTGVRGLYLRLRVLHRSATEQGAGLRSVVAYMNDLRKSVEPTVGYPEAFSAQVLNQQLFFHHFPAAREESFRRVVALLELVRAENPGMLLVMSLIPSYQLAQQRPVDDALHRVLERLPITYEGGVREEQELYDAVRYLAEEHGWLVVDNLRGLREYDGSDRLYNDFDYHLLPVASEIIGRQQAAVILQAPRHPE
jgi:hypothetical protein